MNVQLGDNSITATESYSSKRKVDVRALHMHMLRLSTVWNWTSNAAATAKNELVTSARVLTDCLAESLISVRQKI